jgi:mannose-6-phosphate isomerase-like protein (cupin superfamily)
MSAKTAPVIVNPTGRTPERFENPEHGNLTWLTLFSGDRTPTAQMSAGITEVPPHGGFLKAHRHAQAEIYFVHEGAGVLTIDDVESQLAAGMSVFIPGDAEHSVRNDTAAPLKIFYVFPTDRFGDVVYRFS